MREIKFRAWDKEAKQMIYSEGGECDYCFLFDGEGKIYCCYLLTDIDYEGTEYTKEIRLDNIMQYTGLKDKNGTEIFEGDIVIFNHIKDEYPEVENIFFHNVNRTEYQKKYVAEFCNTYYRYGLRFRNGSTHFMVVQATITNHNVEVIGNIYENPELLEGRE